MKKLLCVLSIGAALLAAPSAVLAQATPAPAAQTTDADPALWVVKDEDTTIYLFGTIHVLKPGLSWFDDGVKKAFDESAELVLEMIEPEPAQMQSIIASKAIDADGPPLTQKLSDKDRADYTKAMQEYGLPVAMFEPMKPWMAAVSLGVAPLAKLGYDPNSGAEEVLTAAAKSAGKKIGALETAEEQLGFFDGLPEAEQIAFLNSTVDELPTFDTAMGEMIGHWAKGHPDKLAELMNETADATPQLAKALLTDRNIRWAQWIGKRLETPGTVFVAVGAGHLAGKVSVQEQLKALKIDTVRVSY